MNNCSMFVYHMSSWYMYFLFQIFIPPLKKLLDQHLFVLKDLLEYYQYTHCMCAIYTWNISICNIPDFIYHEYLIFSWVSIFNISFFISSAFKSSYLLHSRALMRIFDCSMRSPVFWGSSRFTRSSQVSTTGPWYCFWGLGMLLHNDFLASKIHDYEISITWLYNDNEKSSLVFQISMNTAGLTVQCSLQ